MGELAGLTAVVTGGASGIGLAVVRRLAESGARVCVLDIQDPPSDAPADFVRTDLADRPSVDAGIAGAVALLGGLDVLVNNAGIGARGTALDNEDDEWARVLSINVTAIARTAAAAHPYLLRSRAASIVNVSSVVADVGVPQRALYSASKGAVRSLTLAMAADFVRSGIRVNCVTPGTADTPWVQRLLDASADPDRERRQLEARQPIGRLVTAAEVADAVVFLAGPSGSAVTGTALAVDGGMSGIRLPG
jgi:NAD(P)-dependent dehydrogenase (short-subunit alcohol dehydrogenase family)